MGLISWIGNLLKKDTNVIDPISVYKLETQDKIIETKIQPVKIPTILDIGERLALIIRDVSNIKNDMVSRGWFEHEFEDATPKIMSLLNEINQNLLNILSNFTKNKDILSIGDKEHFAGPMITPDYILKIIKSNDKIRYKEIKSQVPISDPTLSKYLKILINSNIIRKIEVGKAVFYETI